MYKYTKLTQHLKHLIETGELKPHEKLPSLRDQTAFGAEFDDGIKRLSRVRGSGGDLFGAKKRLFCCTFLPVFSSARQQ
ncbi:GntR family transcriptional regulator [Glaesserella parasuis]|uniref:GntR family transcriptional regulator n=3 Tax=Glaesserella parasuis TaxID=738 RepID=UPI001920EBDF|nr:GntR family transcriptional regulator [Glaesserella parasuis]